jgi:hypothetical protein
MTVVAQAECATPGCCEESGAGRWGLFCPKCAAFLADIAVTIELQGRKMHRGAMDPHAKKKAMRSRGRAPTCTVIGCDEPRVPPDDFCPTCRAEGKARDDG